MKNLNIRLHKNITIQEALCGTNFTIQFEDGKKVKVKLQPGVYNGQVIRLKNFGLSDDNGERGDTYITLNLLDHPFFKIKGLSLEAIFIVSPDEALNGAVKNFPGPDGKIIPVRIAPRSQNGDIICIKGAGLKKDNKFGNLNLIIQIENQDEWNKLFNSVFNNQSDFLLN